MDLMEVSPAAAPPAAYSGGDRFLLVWLPEMRRALGEVCVEVVSECRDLRAVLEQLASPGVRARRSKHRAVVDAEPLHVRMREVADAH